MLNQQRRRALYCAELPWYRTRSTRVDRGLIHSGAGFVSNMRGVAKTLGKDEDLLHDIAMEMELEDDCLTV